MKLFLRFSNINWGSGELGFTIYGHAQRVGYSSRSLEEPAQLDS